MMNSNPSQSACRNDAGIVAYLDPNDPSDLYPQPLKARGLQPSGRGGINSKFVQLFSRSSSNVSFVDRGGPERCPGEVDPICSERVSFYKLQRIRARSKLSSHESKSKFRDVFAEIMSFSVPEVLYLNFGYPFAMFPPGSVSFLKRGRLGQLGFPFVKSA